MRGKKGYDCERKSESVCEMPTFSTIFKLYCKTNNEQTIKLCFSFICIPFSLFVCGCFFFIFSTKYITQAQEVLNDFSFALISLLSPFLLRAHTHTHTLLHMKKEIEIYKIKMCLIFWFCYRLFIATLDH